MKFIYICALLIPVISSAMLLTKSFSKDWKRVLTFTLGIELALSLEIAFSGKPELVMFRLLDLPFTLAPDTVGCFFGVLFCVLFLAPAVFATEYLEHDNNPIEFGIVYLLTFDAMLGVSWSGNLQTYYMFFECLTLASFPLILHDLRSVSRKAASKYLCYSLFGAGLVLFGMVECMQLFGTLDFTAGGHAVIGGTTALALATAFITAMGFGCKAGIMPLHDWLPTAHPQAPAPASAILSGCVTKAGALGILRVVYFLFGTSFLRGTWVQTTLIAISLVTVFCGSMLAYKEKVLKKRLAYSTVSQVSYALFGMLLMSTAGFIGAMLQVLFHAVTKVCLFLCAGSVIHHTGIERIYSEEGEFNFSGLGKFMPLTMLGYSLASLSLVGLPPFGGFVSKWYLAEGSFAALGMGGWIGAATLLVSALLTAGYLLSITAKAFFPSPEDKLCRAHEATWRMTVPIMALAVSLIILGVYTFGLSDVFAGAAAQLL